MIVREDDISLCGFYSKEEEEMFKLLTSVSKVGTKVGMGILSFAPPARIQAIIITLTSLLCQRHLELVKRQQRE